MTAPAAGASALAKLCRAVDAFKSRLPGAIFSVFQARAPRGLALLTVSLRTTPSNRYTRRRPEHTSGIMIYFDSARRCEVHR